jgi:hypothetical protein
LKHFASPEFWQNYRNLPPDVRNLADQKFALLKADRRHGSIRLKKIGRLYYRVLAKERPEGFVWFWIGPHREYDRIIRGS